MKKFIAALLTAAALLPSLPAMAAPQAGSTQPLPAAIKTGMPNPYIEYHTLAEMKNVLGFEPLSLPPAASYSCTTMYIIGDAVAELHFVGQKDEAASSCIIRSARIDIAGLEDISGYYQVQWEDLHMSQTDLQVAQLDYDSYVARWTHGKYTFSFVGNTMSVDKYHQLLRLLVQRTEQKYNDR